MRTSFVSTLSFTTSPRTNFIKLQQQLADATKEVVTGRHADIGNTLGARSGRLVTLRNEMDNLDALRTGNAVASARLDQSQVALSNVADTGNELLRSTLSLPGSAHAVRLLKDQAVAGLSSFVSAMNASDGRSYLFAGTNTDVKPLQDVEGASMGAVDAALSAAFGLPAADPQSSPLLVDILPDEMQSFLDGAFADLFSAAGWQSDWSTADDRGQVSRISNNRTITTSASANEAALRKLAEGYTMIARIGLDGLRADTRQVVIDHAAKTLSGALSDLAGLQARLGVAQQEIQTANTRLSLELDIVANRIISEERVDPAEKKIEIDTLSTQIEMSYSLTSRIMNLSILNYR